MNFCLLILQIMLKSNRPADAEMLQRKILHALELSKVRLLSFLR